MTPQPTPTFHPFHRISQQVARLDLSHWVASHAFLLASLVVLVLAIAYRLSQRGKKPSRHRLAVKADRLLGLKGDAHCQVKMPRRADATGTVIQIRYPDSYPATARRIADLPEIIATMYGGVWQLDNHTGNRLFYRRLPLPGELPDYVAYDGSRFGIHQVPFAKDRDGRWVIGDLLSQSPHVLIAGTTGKGKTSALIVWVTHVASRGGLADVLDPKLSGYVDTFDAAPNVRVHTEIEDMIAAVCEFHADMMNRHRQLQARADITDPRKYPTRLLVIDEMGSFMSRIKDNWADSKGRSDPPSSPTERQLLEILHMGRAADMHLIVAPQQASANVIGSSDKREQFDMRISCGVPGGRGGRFLFDDQDLPWIDPAHKGRGLAAVQGGDVTPIQLAHIAPPDVRKLTTRGGLSFAAYDVARGQVAPSELPKPPVELQSDPIQQTAESGEVRMQCGQCKAEIVTRSQSVARCRACGHRQRIPSGSPRG